MIYKKKYDVSRERVSELKSLSYLEYPVLITKDAKLGYYEVWEVEEFNPDTLSIEIKNEDGKVLISGEMVVEE